MHLGRLSQPSLPGVVSSSRVELRGCRRKSPVRAFIDRENELQRVPHTRVCSQRILPSGWLTGVRRLLARDPHAHLCKLYCFSQNPYIQSRDKYVVQAWVAV